MKIAQIEKIQKVMAYVEDKWAGSTCDVEFWKDKVFISRDKSDIGRCMCFTLREIKNMGLEQIYDYCDIYLGE